jgi:Bifunctional DNA primase/polymerase, N-terminal
MPDGVVGIDIDVYKHSETALKVIRELPATVRSTSRDDGSGIYLYRVPPGTKLNGSISGAGEAIQPFHRYGVVWPSVHPDGYEYLWLNGRDQEVDIWIIHEARGGAPG